MKKLMLFTHAVVDVMSDVAMNADSIGIDRGNRIALIASNKSLLY